MRQPRYQDSPSGNLVRSMEKTEEQEEEEDEKEKRRGQGRRGEKGGKEEEEKKKRKEERNRGESDFHLISAFVSPRCNKICKTLKIDTFAQHKLRFDA